MATGPSDRYDSHRRLNQPAVDEKSRRWRDHWRARSPVTSVSNRLQDSIRLSCGSRSVVRRSLVRSRKSTIRGFSCGFPLSRHRFCGDPERCLGVGSACRIRSPSSDDLWPSFLYDVRRSGTARSVRCWYSPATRPATRPATPQSSCCRRRTVMTGALRR